MCVAWAGYTSFAMVLAILRLFFAVPMKPGALKLIRIIGVFNLSFIQ